VGGAYTNDQYEFVELTNISAMPVTLYRYEKSAPWRFTDGIEFTFAEVPDEVTIAAGARIVIAKEPEAFMWRYPDVPAEVIFGPYEGNLSNAGERLELGSPGDVDKFGDRRYIREDRVVYSDGSHPKDQPGNVDLWPTGADWQGLSLHRITDSEYGNDPANWQAGAPSPGQ
jgi:hypothetical protein